MIFKKKQDGLTYFTDDKKRIERAFVLGIADIICVLISSFLAIWVRFDFSITKIDHPFFSSVKQIIPFNVVSVIIIFILFQLYKSVWRYASADEMIKIVSAILTEGVVCLVINYAFKINLPRSFFLFYPMFLGIFTAGIRFSYRFLRILKIGMRVKAKTRKML